MAIKQNIRNIVLNIPHEFLTEEHYIDLIEHYGPKWKEIYNINITEHYRTQKVYDTIVKYSPDYINKVPYKFWTESMVLKVFNARDSAGKEEILSTVNSNFKKMNMDGYPVNLGIATVFHDSLIDSFKNIPMEHQTKTMVMMAIINPSHNYHIDNIFPKELNNISSYEIAKRVHSIFRFLSPKFYKTLVEYDWRYLGVLSYYSPDLIEYIEKNRLLPRALKAFDLIMRKDMKLFGCSFSWYKLYSLIQKKPLDCYVFTEKEKIIINNLAPKGVYEYRASSSNFLDSYRKVKSEFVKRVFGNYSHVALRSGKVINHEILINIINKYSILAAIASKKLERTIHELYKDQGYFEYESILFWICFSLKQPYQDYFIEIFMTHWYEHDCCINGLHTTSDPNYLHEGRMHINKIGISFDNCATDFGNVTYECIDGKIQVRDAFVDESFGDIVKHYTKKTCKAFIRLLYTQSFDQIYCNYFELYDLCIKYIKNGGKLNLYFSYQYSNSSYYPKKVSILRYLSKYLDSMNDHVYACVFSHKYGFSSYFDSHFRQLDVDGWNKIVECSEDKYLSKECFEVHTLDGSIKVFNFLKDKTKHNIQNVYEHDKDTVITYLQWLYFPNSAMLLIGDNPLIGKAWENKN